MVEKQPKTPAAKKSLKHNKENPADISPEAVDRPGFDLGGSTGKTRAGTGLGLGPSDAETRRDRRLPGRRGKGK